MCYHNNGLHSCTDEHLLEFSEWLGGWDWILLVNWRNDRYPRPDFGNILDVSPLFVFFLLLEASNSGDWWGHRDSWQVLKETWREDTPMFYCRQISPHCSQSSDTDAVLHRGKCGTMERWSGASVLSSLHVPLPSLLSFSCVVKAFMFCFWENRKKKNTELCFGEELESELGHQA